MKKLMQNLVTDEKSSWITVGVVVLIVIMTIVRAATTEAPKGRGEFANYDFVASARPCKPAAVVNTENEVLIALRNVVTAFSGKGKC